MYYRTKSSCCVEIGGFVKLLDKMILLRQAQAPSSQPRKVRPWNRFLAMKLLSLSLNQGLDCLCLTAVYPNGNIADASVQKGATGLVV